MSEIYKESEFDGLQPNQIQQLGNTIYQRINQKRNYYQNQRSNSMISPYQWNDLQQMIANFDLAYNNWSRNWGNVSRQQTSKAFIDYFNQIVPEINKLDEKIDDLRPKYEHSESVEEIKKEILAKIDSDLANLANQINIQITNGIQDLIDLKAEYKLQDTFFEAIKSERKYSDNQRKLYLNLFVGSVLLIPMFLLFSFLIPRINDLAISLQWSIRVTISVTLGLLSIFFFNQYRVSRIILLKYKHLSNFIGGGATFISELIGLNEEAKKDVNRKLADMFINIEDLMSSIKRSKHPSENAMESARKIVDSVTKNATELTKTLK